MTSIKMSESTEKTSEEPKEELGGCFVCSQCGMEETYHYKGFRPPFARNFTFLEEGYIMKDPFSPPGRGKCLLLGSDCVKCGQSVCCASSCSIFYSQRFCANCLRKFSAYFPQEVINKLQANK